jgi:cytochrome c oxidase subunit I
MPGSPTATAAPAAAPPPQASAASGAQAAQEHAIETRLLALWRTEPGLYGWFGTVDHKKIGKRYLVTAFTFLVVAGIEALVMRAQLARPDAGLLKPEEYNQLFTMHGMTMIFWYASPILSGFANYLIPLMLGARDMAFPRLNAFTYWTFLLSGLFLYGAVPFGESPHGGWFAYVPYTTSQYSPGLGMDFYALSLIFLTISTTAGAINFLVTIFRHRAPGMSLSRMPLFMYSTSTISAAIVFSLPALTVACVFLELERRWGFHFYDPRHGGDPVLWQHLFWFFGHPWVYVIFLPATGMISMLLPVFSRRPIVGYPYVALATVMTGLVGFGVWVHHMFAVGMSFASMSFFSAASMTISIFSTVQVLAWIATVWKGRPVLTTSMLFALGFIANFIIGGLNGVVTAIVPFDWQVHDTYFVVTHLHYVLIGANVFPVFAALYFWVPKMTGRLMNEVWGRVSFALMFIGFNVAFFPMHILGVLGMPRRIWTYPADKGWGGLNLLVSIGSGVLALGVLVTIANFFASLRRGARAGKNPWNADGLEWSTTSPPEVYGSTHIPTIVSRHPLWDEHEEEADPRGERVLDGGRFTVSTTAVDAAPVGLARMPEDTLTPVLAGLALTGLFTALLARQLWVAAGAAAATLLVFAAWMQPQTRKEEDKRREARAASPEAPVPEPLVADLDRKRGTAGMCLFIATELALFVMLFFGYYRLGPWPTEQPPKLRYALIMLGVLVLSSIVLHWGESLLKKGELRRARRALLGTILLGVGFMTLQLFEYVDHLKTLTPQSGSYGSIFYTITSFHGAHLALGFLMLAYVLFLPAGPTARPPHRAYENASRYWHFVDFVWVFIVALLYVVPNLRK